MSMREPGGAVAAHPAAAIAHPAAAIARADASPRIFRRPVPALALCLVAALWSTADALAAPAANLLPDAVPHLGRPISAADAATAGSTIYPDGRGLPAGAGNAVTGKAVFAQQCARCHGEGGRGGSAPELVGGTVPLNGKRPDKTIGLYWPAAPTLFDFNWRAMPMDKPGSLTADEAYAVTAYLLYADGVIGENARIDAASLPAVKMPNRNGFRWIDAKQPAPLP